MNTLAKLKGWRSLADAARHISRDLDEEVSEVNLLESALDKKLVLSVNFMSPTEALHGKCVPVTHAHRVVSGPKMSVPITYDTVLEVRSWTPKPIEGVWDLPMVGAEQLVVKQRYHELTDTTSSRWGPVRIESTALMLSRVSRSAWVYFGSFVRRQDGSWCRLDKYEISDSGGPAGSVPMFEWPDDAILVVRTAVLEELARRMPTLPDEKRPIPTAVEPPDAPSERTEPASEIEPAHGPPDDPVPFDLAAQDLQISGGRKKAVEAFLADCNRTSQERILKKHIWQAMGYKNPRPFQYWLAMKGPPKETPTCAQNARHILGMSVTDFLDLLRRKRLI